MEDILVKQISTSIPAITVSKIGDWIDLRSAEEVFLKQGEFALIPLGVAMKIPNGYEALLAPRSSFFKNHKCIQTNSVGVIDNSFSGDEDEWKLPVLCFEDTVIEKGERICQFRIIPNQPRVSITYVDHLTDESRGGFGSTGKL